MVDSKIIKNSIIDNPVIVTGLGRSGKWALSTLISSFKRAEHVSVDYLMEEIIMMHMLDKVDQDVTVALIRYAIDLMGHNIFLGRNVNIRSGEYTSIRKSGKLFLFLKRLFSKDNGKILERIKEKNPLFVVLVHDALWHFDIYNKAFVNMKMIHIWRNPIDVVYSWYSKGHGADFKNSLTGTVTIEAQDKHLLYYAVGRENEYAQMNQMDRVINMVNQVVNNHLKRLNALIDSEKNKLKIVVFEKIVVDPIPYLEDIAKFLDTEITKYTVSVCKQQRCPRQLFKEDSDKKLTKIKENSSPEAFKILMDMVEEYELLSK